MKPLPSGVEMGPPAARGIYTVKECDEVLRRRVKAGRIRNEVTDAWLDERLRAVEAVEQAKEAA